MNADRVPRAGTVVGLAAAGLVTLVCLANLVLSLNGGSIYETIFWAVGALIGGFGLLVFVLRARR